MKSSFKTHPSAITTGELLLRFITSIAILWTTAFFTPNFEIASLFSLLVVAIVLTIFDYLINSVFLTFSSSIARGIIGFFSCAIILYMTQFFIDYYQISIFSSLVGALIYAMVASLVFEKQYT